MIAREELRFWTGNPEAQAETMGKVEEAARRLKTTPFVERLKECTKTLVQPSGAAILAAAAQVLDDEEGLAESFACLVEAAAQDPFFRPALRSIHSEMNSGILLLDRPELSVVLSILPADALAAKRMRRCGPASIVFPGQMSLYKFVRAGGAIFSFWEAPAILPSFTAEASGRCRLVGRREMRDGELLQLDGRRESFVIDHAVGDLVYLHTTTSLDCAPLTVEYDLDTLDFAGASSTDDVSSRTQMMLALLRTMDRRDAVPVFVEMLSHRHFYTRWQAMRELLALDAEAALPYLRIMADADPHAEVRDAAAATLGACFPADQPATAAKRVAEYN
ncbi:MAG TPA: HEAT repeat domain-containing protein [Allosphingosinicella sp.]|nr:HEAT repeat domain-containing protein [Allosphingosinicella sp.]